ncbi:MAG: phosphoribosylamine--glycine ligase, partial [Deltaproteobacteria bacterium]
APRVGANGPNTGGMGAVSPNPGCTKALCGRVLDTMVRPVLRHFVAQQTPYCGFLFVGVMLTEAGPQLLEFNVRLGDPEAQAILPRLDRGEFLRLCAATAAGELGDFALQTDPRPSCAVVLAAAGYPGTPRLGDPIALSEALASDVDPDCWLVQAGTALRDGVLRTAGGRVACVVARGDNLPEARRRCYSCVSQISFAGMQVRSDIGEGVSKR